MFEEGQITMAHVYHTECLDCREVFTVARGGGFYFYIVRCDTCGQSRNVPLPHLRLRTPGGSSGISSPEYHGDDREHAPVGPGSQDERHRRIEARVGRCRCGGQFSPDAPPRCPKCRSARLKEGPIFLFTD